MANQFNTNLTPTTYAHCMYQFMVCLYNAGWSILAWSDGLTVRNTGTIPGPYAAGPGSPDSVFPLTGAFANTGASGANGMDNNSSWFVLRQPKASGSISGSVYAGRRTFVFQRGTSDFSWRLKMSVGGGGTPAFPSSQYQFASDATHVPSLYSAATQDEVTFLGGGTDASPTFATLFGGIATNRGLIRFNVMANDGLSGETAPFGVWASAFKVGGGLFPDMGFIIDPLTPGTIAPGELDPYLYGVMTNVGSTTNGSFCPSNGNPADSFMTWAGTQGQAFAWMKYGMTGAIAQRIVPLMYFQLDTGLANQMAVPGITVTGGNRWPLGTNPINSEDDLFPMCYARPPAAGTGISGYKGVASMMKFNGSPRSVGDTQSQNTVRDRIIMGICSLPWDASVPTI